MSEEYWREKCEHLGKLLTDTESKLGRAERDLDLLQTGFNDVSSKLDACESENAALRTCMERVRAVLADVHAMAGQSSAMSLLAAQLQGALVDPREAPHAAD